MITSLTLLTMRQYIDLVCGDLDVIREAGEQVDPEDLSAARVELIGRFVELADPQGSKARVRAGHTRLRRKSEEVLFKVLANLAAAGFHDVVRQQLAVFGFHADNLDNAAVEREVKSRYERARADIKRLEEADSADEKKAAEEADPRMYYERQAAGLMAYFKFQIDLNVITASQFACLIDQADREMKARLSAMSHK